MWLLLVEGRCSFWQFYFSFHWQILKYLNPFVVLQLYYPLRSKGVGTPDFILSRTVLYSCILWCLKTRGVLVKQNKLYFFLTYVDFTNDLSRSNYQYHCKRAHNFLSYHLIYCGWSNPWSFFHHSIRDFTVCQRCLVQVSHLMQMDILDVQYKSTHEMKIVFFPVLSKLVDDNICESVSVW